MAPFSRFRVFAPRLVLLPPPWLRTQPDPTTTREESAAQLRGPRTAPWSACEALQRSSFACLLPSPTSGGPSEQGSPGKQASRPASKSFLGSWIWWSRPMAQLALFPGCPGARSHGRLSLGGAKTVGSCCIAGYLQLSCLDRPTARRSERCMPVSHITLAPALALALAHTVHTRAHRLNSHNSPCPGTMDSKQ